MESGRAVKMDRAYPSESAAQPSKSGGSPLAAPKSLDKSMSRAKSFVAVVGHGPMVEREEGAAGTLRQLGSSVGAVDLWDGGVGLIDDEGGGLGVGRRGLVFG